MILIQILILVGIYFIPAFLSMRVNRYLYRRYDDVRVLPGYWFVPLLNILVLVALVVIVFVHDCDFFKEEYWENKWEKRREYWENKWEKR